MKGNLVNDARLAALVAAVSDLLAAMARASDLDRAAVLNARMRCRELVDEITANAARKYDRTASLPHGPASAFREHANEADGCVEQARG